MENNAQILFDKLLNNECSVEEVEQLIALLSDAEANAVYKELVLSQLAQPVNKNEISDGLRKKLDLRLQQILKNETPVVVLGAKTKLGYTTRYLVAATILIFISVGVYFGLHKKTTKQQFSQNQLSDVSPGGNKAILTLANGKKIVLTDSRNGKLAQQGSTTISKTANGEVVYLQDQSASNATTAKTEYNMMVTPLGGQYHLTLADGTDVWLNAESSIKYPTAFSGNERKVEITGEAYFEVAHNKAMPFKVISQGQTIEVLGTHFDVMAYSGEKSIKTTLLEGSVKISDNGNIKLLIPGEQSQTTADAIKLTRDVDLEEVVAWKNGYFKFNENIESIMNKVSRWYNVDVVYQLKPDPELTFSGKISRTRNLSAILKMLEFNGDVHFKIEGRRVTVMK
jgi:transmembrane sensor